MMEYKGYTARVDYDDGDAVFHGQVLYLRDVITFEGTSVRELRKAFRDSIEDYLAFCAQRGEQPEKPFSGRFIVRTDPELHREIAMAAARADESINGWVVRALDCAVRQRNAEPHVA